MPTKKSPKKTCFVIAPIGEDGSPIRKRSDQVLTIIKHAVEPLGYTVSRADDDSDPNLITQRVISRLFKDDLVVADLTGANANVYYELAVRHLTARPAVGLIQKGEKPRFDIADMRTIQFNLKDGAGTVNVVKRITDAVSETEKPSYQAINPITTTMQRLGARFLIP